MSRLIALTLACGIVCLSGCANRKPPAAPPQLSASEIHAINFAYYDELNDDEPCCAPLDEWMPKLFAPAKPRAKLPMEEMPMMY